MSSIKHLKSQREIGTFDVVAKISCFFQCLRIDGAFGYVAYCAINYFILGLETMEEKNQCFFLSSPVPLFT